MLIDLSQATLLPGLIDCHAHLLSSGEIHRDSSGGPLLSLTRASDSLRALMGARHAREALEAGITSARILGHSGIDCDISLRDAINAGWLPGPRLQVSVRKITAVGAVNPPAIEHLQAGEFLPVSGPDEARRAVRENAGLGADVIKIVIDAGTSRSGLKRYMPLDDARAIVTDAHRQGLKVAAHAEDKDAVQIAIDAEVDSIEHAWSITDEQLSRMKEQGIYLCATDLLVSQSPKERLQRALKIGVKIAVGSDMWIAWAGKNRGEASPSDPGCSAQGGHVESGDHSRGDDQWRGAYGLVGSCWRALAREIRGRHRRGRRPPGGSVAATARPACDEGRGGDQERLLRDLRGT